MTIRRGAPLVLATLALLGRAPSVFAQGCAMCGGSFGQNDPTTNAFNTSILFMMLAPYAIFFTAAGVIVFLYRRGLLARRAPVIPLHRRRMPAPADGPKEVTP
jgi:hypothetical protein